MAGYTDDTIHRRWEPEKG